MEYAFQRLSEDRGNFESGFQRRVILTLLYRVDRLARDIELDVGAMRAVARHAGAFQRRIAAVSA